VFYRKSFIRDSKYVRLNNKAVFTPVLLVFIVRFRDEGGIFSSRDKYTCTNHMERVFIMSYEEKYKKPEQPHNLILEGRRRLSVSGVEDVESFDEHEVTLSTVSGALIVKGTELHIEKLSLDGGDLVLEGEVESITYEASQREKGSFWSRLFK